jgi:PAS domain S-box-containing protein
VTYLLGAVLLLVTIQATVVVVLLIREKRRARAEQALRASEERFRLLADHAPVIIWTARPDTTLDYVNRTCVEFTGLPFERLLDEGWLDVVHPDDRDRCTELYVPAFEARRPFLMEYRARRTDGAYRWLLAMGVPRYGLDGSFAGYLGCDVDITERKEAEERIHTSQIALETSHREIQQLAGRLIEAQDAERARVARDLHDDVSQQLAGLSIALSSLRRRVEELRGGEGLEADVRALHQRTSTLAQNVRHLSHDLHPTVLRHAGLVAALTSHCAELERAHGTVLSCRAEGDFGSLAPEVALCFYRIAQEALRNVIAHSGARRAEVSLLRTGSDAEITIVDDGAGFDVARSLELGKGLGLVSIRERARLVGGTIFVASGANKGTRVHARVPALVIARTDARPEATAGQRELSFS